MDEKAKEPVRNFFSCTQLEEKDEALITESLSLWIAVLAGNVSLGYHIIS